jgi:hypothetical protein
MGHVYKILSYMAIECEERKVGWSRCEGGYLPLYAYSLALSFFFNFLCHHASTSARVALAHVHPHSDGKRNSELGTRDGLRAQRRKSTSAAQ